MKSQLLSMESMRSAAPTCSKHSFHALGSSSYQTVQEAAGEEGGHFPICQQVSASLASISDLLPFKNASRGKAGRAKYLLLESEVCKEMKLD